jgi:5-hydroxytryptamine receptor 2
MISVDRYMSLTFPLRYGSHAKRSCKQTFLKILLVWVISFCIAGPLFLFSMLDTTTSAVAYKGCGPETPTFVISATVTSFYLPLLIMTIMYALTMRALRCQLHEQRRLAVTNSLSSRDDSTYSLRRGATASAAGACSPRGSPRLPHRPNGFHAPAPPSSAAGCLADTSDFLFVHGASTMPPPLSPSSTCTDVDEVADLEIDVRPAALQCKQRRFIMRRFRFGRAPATTTTRRSVHGGLDRGRRAVQVLGILFAVFVVCYAPFFLTYVIKGTCTRCQSYISPRMIMAFEWLAYSGSVVNPIIYHVFNPDFRRAFQRLLCCRCVQR